MDELLKKYQKHIASVFNVECNIFDVRLNTFDNVSKMFCSRCPHKCDFKTTHLYGCYESVRWDNKYIYYCPTGFIFIAVPVFEELSILSKCIIIGPVLMGNSEEFDETYGLPNLSTVNVNDIAEIVSAIFVPRMEKQEELKGNFLNAIYKELEVVEKRYPIEIEKELQQSIIEGDGTRSRELINKLLGQIFFNSNGELKKIKARVMELIVLLSRSAIEGGADIGQIFNLNNGYISEIERLNSIEDISVWLSNVIQRFIGYVFEFGDVKHADTIFKITAYVKENYMKKITLNDVANHVYLSKTYVSKIFKDEMKISLSAYINKTRIEKSKLLLLDSSLSLADVANLSGFDDQSYFTKTFKSITGVSPGKYKEKHIKA